MTKGFMMSRLSQINVSEHNMCILRNVKISLWVSFNVFDPNLGLKILYLL